MIVAVPIQESSKNADLSMKFARSRFFAIINKFDNTLKIVENPYDEMKNGVGKNIVGFLSEQHSVGTFAAFEFGLKVQQLALEKNIRLVMINEMNNNLKQLLQMMVPDLV